MKSQSELSFHEYCLANNVNPLENNQTVFIPKPQHKKIERKDTAVANITYDFLNSGDSYNEYYNCGQKKLVKELRNGKYKIIAILDLHNHTQAEAMLKLQQFIDKHTTIGNTCLKIIHGKGLNSPNSTSVLKVMVRRYLEHQPRLLAYSYANINEGGDGVTLIKLRQ